MTKSDVGTTTISILATLAVWEALLWIVVIFAVFAPLAVARYRRAAGN